MSKDTVVKFSKRFGTSMKNRNEKERKLEKLRLTKGIRMLVENRGIRAAIEDTEIFESENFTLEQEADYPEYERSNNQTNYKEEPREGYLAQNLTDTYQAPSPAEVSA